MLFQSKLSNPGCICAFCSGGVYAATTEQMFSINQIRQDLRHNSSFHIPNLHTFILPMEA